MDLPVRIYSSGMVIRLGFALATAIKPQILLMDEWFLAGDADFMAKARARLEEMVRGAEIMVLSSHQDTIVREWCTRVLWMDQGRIRADGPADEVLAQYLGRPAVQPEALPGGEQPVGELPGGEQPVAELPGGEQHGGELTAVNSPAGN
jgi:lipopolysaccharide transport system ATP-binding protein